MNLKDRLIKKLLNVGKKHRVLVYPTLALIAVISAASHAVCWGKGNGKKVMASLMVVVMLITQSLFLTSSADGGEIDDTASEGDAEEAAEVISKNVQVVYNMLDENGNSTPYEKELYVELDSDENAAANITVQIPSDSEKAEWFFEDSSQLAYFTFTPCYSDYEMTSELSEGDNVVALPEENADGKYVYNVYFKATRTSYPVVVISGEQHVYYAGLIPVPEDTAEGDIDPATPYEIGEVSTYDNDDYVGIYKRGYNFTGVTYNNAQYSIGSTVTIAPEGFVDQIVFTPEWSSMQFDVDFVAVKTDDVEWPTDLEFPSEVVLNDGADNVKTVTGITYSADTSLGLFTDSDMWAGNEAYILAGWRYYDSENDTYVDITSVDDVRQLAEKYGSVKNEVNIKGVTLYAIWTYRYVKLDVSNSDAGVASASVDNQNVSVDVSGTYGDSVDFTIVAEYRDGRQDDTEGTKFTYELGTVTDTGVSGDTTLARYGLTGVQMTDKNGIKSGYRIYGSFSDVTEGSSAVTIPINIIDSNSQITTTYYITFNIAKKEVSVNPDTIKGDHGSTEPPKKQYNGLLSIGVTDSAQVYDNSSSLSGKINNDDVYVVMSSEATLDDPNASDSLKAVTLHSVSLDGKAAGFYKLVDANGNAVADNGDLKIESVATVDRCDVKVEISRADGTDDPVLFGQATPEYILTITNPVNLAGDSSTIGSDEYRYVTASSDADRMDFIADVLGFTGWNTGNPARTQFSSPGTYTIKPVFDKSISNYKVEMDNAEATFVVVQEDAAKDVNYKYSTNIASNGFYPGLKITATGEYTLIRELKDGDTPVDETTTSSDIASWFTSEIKIDDCVNKTIKFQLYKPIDPSDPSKGCSITTVETDVVSVDNSGPEYVSHQLVDVMKDKVNTNQTFGAYYHTQNGIETISITFVFKSDFSECDLLHYYFLPEGSTTKGGEITTKMERVQGTNNYTATITIGTANSGQLIVYADNTTGGVSTSKRIKIDTAEDFDINSSNISNGYYEWMVENNPSAGGDIVVTDMDGNTISDTSEWYNGIMFSTKVTDVQSGIDRIEWHITDSNGKEVDADYSNVFELADLAAVAKEYGKITSYNFKNSVSGDDLSVGEYYISATVYDNAGNETEISKVGPFKLDCHAPVITDLTASYDNQYTSNVTFEFTVVEAENESGIDKVVLYNTTDGDEKGITLSPVDGANGYSYSVDSDSSYRIEATDKAGNVRTYTKNFTGISNVKPSKPVISVTGTIGSNDWYKETQAEIHISASSSTSDNVPVNTQYRLTYEDHYVTGVVPSAQASDYVIPITNDGLISIEAWSVSEADLQSLTASATVKVDTTAPEITIGESATDEAGNIVINYTVTDATSGIDKILINGETVEYSVDGNTATGSFVVAEDKEYVISATDIAGNTSGDTGFTPLEMTASPVMNITTTSAYLEADIYEGTYIVDDYYITYKKHSDSKYTTALISDTDTDYGIHVECNFRKLSPATAYDYKIYAITKTSKEVKLIEGSFETGSDISMASIRGTAVYDDSVLESYQKYPIYVSLYDGNTYVAGQKITDATNPVYEFTNVADGTYRIVATDGLLVETGKVIVANGGIVYPDNYLSSNGINFVLDGLSTSVVIEDNSINLTTDGLEAIFDSMSYYEGVIDKDDKAVLAAGGSIEISLHAKYIDEDELTADELEEFNDNMSSDEHIEKYVSVYILKIVRDADGNTSYEPEYVPMLYDDIELTFPLGELSGERVYVAVAHEEKNGEYTFKKWNGDGDLAITENYVTIETNLFSIYALYTVDTPLETHIVKWIGDGQVLKTEIVTHGSSATPPEVTPTKDEDDNYTYRFGGWNVTDYSNITEDTKIVAWFTKIKKDTTSTENQTTESTSTTEKATVTEESTTTEKSTTEKTTDVKPTTTEKPSNVVYKPSSTDKTTSTEENGKQSTESTITTANGNEPTYSYMGSSESPKTGDEAPIVLMLLLMSASLGGIIMMKKHQNKNN